MDPNYIGFCQKKISIKKRMKRKKFIILPYNTMCWGCYKLKWAKHFLEILVLDPRAMYVLHETQHRARVWVRKEDFDFGDDFYLEDEMDQIKKIYI